jgi:hypothetical protein
MKIKNLTNHQLFEGTASLGVVGRLRANPRRGDPNPEEYREQFASRIPCIRVGHTKEVISGALLAYFRREWAVPTEQHTMQRFAITLFTTTALYGSGLEVQQVANRKMAPGKGCRLGRFRTEENKWIVGVDASHSSLTPGLVIKDRILPERMILLQNTAVGLPQCFNLRIDKSLEEGWGRKGLIELLNRCAKRECTPLEVMRKLVEEWCRSLIVLRERLVRDWEEKLDPRAYLVLAGVFATHCALFHLVRRRKTTAAWALLLRLEIPRDQEELREQLSLQKGALKEEVLGMDHEHFFTLLADSFAKTLLPSE